MPPDYMQLYAQLGRLLQTPPDTSTYQALQQPEALQWLGRGHALVSQVGVGAGFDAISYSQAVKGLSTSAWPTRCTEIFAILFRAMGHCEIYLPATAAGAFIPVGNSFDAYVALAKILQDARTDVMIVDPYLDEAVLTEFASSMQEGVMLRLLADEASHKASLIPAAAKWSAQYGTTRPLAVRLSMPKTLHDRAIFVDGGKAWTLTQSLKDFAKRSPAEIVRADDTAALKVAAYEAIWGMSKVAA